jgi:hypothetical protein
MSHMCALPISRPAIARLYELANPRAAGADQRELGRHEERVCTDEGDDGKQPKPHTGVAHGSGVYGWAGVTTVRRSGPREIRTEDRNRPAGSYPGSGRDGGSFRRR